MKKKPTTLEVADVLREKKLFNHHLNHIEVRRWSEEHLKQWKNIVLGIPEKEAINDKKPRGLNKIKVVRISDGRIYDSITECRDSNNFNNTTMYQLLKDNLHFQRA